MMYPYMTLADETEVVHSQIIKEGKIEKVEDWINNYPRAMFNYKSTNEILSEICA